MTLLGFHTGTELAELLRAKDANVADYDASIRAADTSSPDWPQWISDYRAFRAAWNPVSARAHADADLTSFVWDEVTDQRYNEVLEAIAPLDDLARRWKFGRFVNSGTPQPTAPDQDLDVLNAINALPIVGANAKSSTWKLVAGGAALGIVAIALLKRAV